MITAKAGTFADLVKWEHTIFALPFAYVGAFLGARGLPTAAQAFWILIAMIGGRTAAMALNRLIDWAIDARNPRTVGRHLPRGLMSTMEVLAFTAASLGLLILAAYKLNPLCVKFLPLVVPVLVFYSYTKRFTWACHFWLGLSYVFVPFGGWIAVTGWLELAPVVLGIAAGLWVAGFDVIYATQDMEFDRREGLHSIPARFGLAAALRIARAIHLVVVALLLILGLWLKLGYVYLVGAAIVAALLHYEHAIISPRDMSRLNAAFFNVIGYISIVFFLFTAAAVVS
mgnify:CR=1 FL=1